MADILFNTIATAAKAAEGPSKDVDIATPSAPVEDDMILSISSTNISERDPLEASNSETWSPLVNGNWLRNSSAESTASTGITSICSSIIVDDSANGLKVESIPSRKRMSDGTIKLLSPSTPNVESPQPLSTTPSMTLLEPQPIAKVPRKRGRPPKEKTISVTTTSQPTKQSRTSRTQKSTALQTQIRPRSSIPSHLPAEVLASECIKAAHGSRLNPYALHAGEHELLGARLNEREVTTYLNIRNRILRLWKQNSLCSVTADEATGCAKEVRSFGLAAVAYKWLVRNGYINFGCVEVPRSLDAHKTPAKGARQKTVVVIGAGVSGLTAARQLEGLFAQEATRSGSHVPRVIVLEGRKRVGGRVYSKPLRSQVTGSLPNNLRNTAEMGAMIVTGFEHGNPLDTIIRGQLGVRYHLMRDSLTIYDCNGKPVDERRDMLNTELYTDVSDRAGQFRALPKKQDTLRGDEDLINRGRDPPPEGSSATQLEPLVAGQLRAHQPAVRRGRRRNAPPGTEKLTGRSEVVEGISAPRSAARAVKEMGWALKDGVTKNQSISMHKVATSCAYPTLGNTMDDAIVQYQELIDITPTDMRLLSWHHANLEYANAAPVTSLSLSGHDQDTGNEFEGAHSEVIGGYTQVPQGLMNLPTKLDVRFDHIVETIHYNDRDPSTGSVTTRVACKNGEVFEADEVVLTTPLGVLKTDSIDFDPPLPSWKQGAVERMGFGLLNKVILLYEEAFWDDERDMFGLLNEPEQPDSLDPKDYETRRGRFYLIWNASKTSGRPMLIALMAGHAAYEAEYTKSDVLLDEVTGRLRSVFGAKVPLPIEVIVTRWRQDRFTRGTYSYVAPETQPGDYDLMAKAVGNLHFAGEATCGTHPATVHGALLSGLRVASDVAQVINGPIDVPDVLMTPSPIKQESATTHDRTQILDSQAGAGPTASSTTHQGGTLPSGFVASSEIAIKDEIQASIPLTEIPVAKAPRTHYVLQPAGPPVHSVCPEDPSFWVSASSTATDNNARLDYEAAVVATILSQIGDRPARPARSGGNPFLLYTKDKWEDCKNHCNAKISTSAKSTIASGRDMIRQTLGNWWKAASQVEKEPYIAQSQTAREQSNQLRREWTSAVAKWDIDAARIRREYATENPLPQRSTTVSVATRPTHTSDGISGLSTVGVSRRKTNVSNCVVLDHV